MALTILDYDKKVQNIPTRNISGQNNLGKLTKKNDETYGIFHMLVDPPTPATYGKSIVIFYCLKMISDSF